MASVHIDPHKFSYVANMLRRFFLSKKYVEVHTQNRLGILAACEDSSKISIYNYAASDWPLPQTGKMWLDYELLKDSKPLGYFCVSTKYRKYKTARWGHNYDILPMFEFVLNGDFDNMSKILHELLEYLGYGIRGSFPKSEYKILAKEMGVNEITSKEEMALYEKYFNKVFLIKDFPEYTDPFWNIERYGDKPHINKTTSNECINNWGTLKYINPFQNINSHDNNQCAKKIECILSGMNAINCAELSCDKTKMRNRFFAMSDGKYSGILYDKFGRVRMDNELNKYLSQTFIPRCSGGINITHLISSMQLEFLIPADIMNARL